MGHNDSSLYSGITSQTVRKKAEGKKERASVRAELLPEGSIANAEIDKMIEEMSKIDYALVNEYVTDAEFRSKLHGNAFAIEKMKELKTRFNNMLRDNKDPKQEEPEDE